MVQVTKLRPANEGLARIELGFSREDIKLVEQYDRNALAVFEKDSKIELFRVQLGSYSAFGKTDLVVNHEGDQKENIVFIVKDVKDDVATNVALSNIVKYGNIIEKQVAKAIKAYTELSTSIVTEEAPVVAKAKKVEGK